ncbi:MAG TPA: L,D-transpeptidase family protein [Mucilaginibacter sp.]|jgi:murein L,D-transpeptidase YcbB/YkuD|nr:L,D-transpeptidase family protein [Mucilaginibacter sp.]
MIFAAKTYFTLTTIMFLSAALLFQSCKKRHSDVGQILYQKTQNKIFIDVDPDTLAYVFQKVLAREKHKLTYGSFISKFYQQNNYDPVFVMDHIFNNDLNTAVSYYQNAGQHGLDPELFKANEIARLVSKFYDKNGFKTLNEIYHNIAELEILSANSLLRYSNALQYGAINPKSVYVRYYIPTPRPDTASMAKVFQVTDIKTYLDSIQPKGPQYIALQKALADGTVADGLSPEETKRLIMVNLERLRWRNVPDASKYVRVNIPAFQLDVMQDGKSVLNMKVCVGQGRNNNNSETLMNYTDTGKIDKPNRHSTPQLSSLIRSVDVNPVWNIPQSIADREIIVEAKNDRYYLENKGINVYKDGKLVDADTIDWDGASTADYEFKQMPGDQNSLGKIKFLFNNQSSVYLHDTPAKAAFSMSMRAVSHGCVRLGNPKGLALNLFGEGPKFDLISKDMELDKPEPTSISLSPKVPVLITYQTGWIDDDGTLQARQDVYGLDIVLYNALMTLK